MKRHGLWGLVIGSLVLAMVASACSTSKPAASPAEAKKEAVPAAAPQEKIVIKVSHGYPTTYLRHKGFEKMKELLEAKTNGQVTMEIFPSGQLYKGAAEIEALGMGNVHMINPPAGDIASIEPSFQVVDLPFLFRSEAGLMKWEDSPAASTLLKKLEQKGIVGLGWWIQGTGVVYTNRAIKKVEDLSGLKLRVPSGKVQIESLKLLNVSAVAMPAADVYLAIKNKTIDGQASNITAGWSGKMHEVAKYATIDRRQFFTAPILVNKAWWDKLPAATRDLIAKEVLPETVKWYRTELGKEEATARKNMEANGTTFTEIDDNEFRRFQEIVKPVYEKFKGEIGADLMNQSIDTQK